MAWLTLATLGGCAGLPLGLGARDSADRIAAGAGMEGHEVSAGRFRLLTYRRDDGSGPLHVYLEGDGRAWYGRRPPRDPTPTQPYGLLLAARDPAPSVLWIGRPCMFLPAGEVAHCDVRWWTSHRYAPEVVEAMDRVVSASAAGRRLVLIGHSGGGALATLLAARRRDVAELITVASPLDLSYWTESDHMTPLTGSLDPMEVAPRLSTLPQRHLCGGRDRVVPEAVVRRFVSAIPTPNRARLEVYPDASHHCCWEQAWPRLLHPATSPGPPRKSS